MTGVRGGADRLSLKWKRERDIFLDNSFVIISIRISAQTCCLNLEIDRQRNCIEICEDFGACEICVDVSQDLCVVDKYPHVVMLNSPLVIRGCTPHTDSISLSLFYSLLRCWIAQVDETFLLLRLYSLNVRIHGMNLKLSLFLSLIFCSYKQTQTSNSPGLFCIKIKFIHQTIIRISSYFWFFFFFFVWPQR